MAFGVLIHRSDSIYDDSPAKRYQFPSQYLGRMKACEGDWIIYYEPRKAAATRGYFATARVERVIADPTTPGMYLAEIDTPSYLEFPNPVPFSDENGLVERGLINPEGKISGRAQSAVRPLSPEDFRRIVDLGLGAETDILPRNDDVDTSGGFGDEAEPFVFDNRARASFVASRIVRDRIFRKLILRAYGERCAFTGLRLINGGGRAEVQAAHIQPVEANGPDIMSNGLALSGTMHWMFDRGLITLQDDLRITLSRHVNDVEGVEAMINKSGIARAPDRAADRPHPQFLRWHRDNCFKH